MRTLNKSILVIDDEANVRSLVGDALRIGGFTVTECSNVVEAKLLYRNSSFDAVVCDVVLPGLSGIDFLKWLRSSGDHTPVLLISALVGKNDVIKGFSEGADDYIRKPFSTQELCYRVLSSCRKKFVEDSDEINVSGLLVNYKLRNVEYNGVKVDLTAKEFELLVYFVQNKGNIVKRSSIMRDVWGITHNASSGVIETYIFYLRKKLKSVGWDNLETIRGKGYILTDDR